MSKHLLMIHGAWQGAWAWESVAPELAARSYHCHPVDMPGNGNGDDRTPPDQVSLDLYMTHLKSVIDGIGEEVILVGHSSGGIIASQLAENEFEKVQAVIYIAGMMLPSGMGFADVVEELTPAHPEVAGIIPYLEWSADGETSQVIEGAAQKIFFHDAPSELAKAAAAKLKPHPQRGRAITATLSDARFGQLPRAYIEASLDRSVVLAAQRRMQELVPGATRYTIETGHAPLVSKPRELAELIDRAAKDFSI